MSDDRASIRHLRFSIWLTIALMCVAGLVGTLIWIL